MQTSIKCPACGADTTADWACGHCVPCLLRLGLTEEMETIEPSGAGDCIGHYRLIREIGEGGCGVVFLAEQSEPVRREVAIKIIKPGKDTRQVIARFEAERQMLASLDHPHIAKVFDAGTTESGHPYFVMEWVRGMPITGYCDDQRLSIEDRLELFIEVCNAVQHAHQKGIIHRDLKPSNILVTAGESETGGTPRIIDFGVAKSTGEESSAAVNPVRGRQLLGTPAYMSPEQAGCGEADIDTRTDIYSLGAVLYELVTGATPFSGAALAALEWDEVSHFLRDTEPSRPSARLAGFAASRLESVAGKRRMKPHKLQKMLRSELDWIVMKCLEKNPAKRYETAHALRLDAQHFLRNEPVLARLPTPIYRLQKFVRRNRVAGAATAIVLSSLVLSLGITTRSLNRERQAHQRAMAAEATEHEARVFSETARERALVEAKKTREVAAFLTDVLKSAGPATPSGHNSKILRDIMNKTVARLREDLRDQPDVEAELRTTLAEVCGELGFYPQMEEMAQQALRLSRPTPGVENPVVAKSLEELAAALTHLGRLEEAEASARESLEMQQRLTGNQSAQTATALNNLGLVLRERGRFAEAEKLFREAVTIDEKSSSPEIGKVATDVGNLGAALWSEGKLADAEIMYRRALALRQKSPGDESVEIAATLNNLATVLLSEQKPVEAEPMAREALAMDRKFLGNAHPDTVITLGNLANILHAQWKTSLSYAQ